MRCKVSAKNGLTGTITIPASKSYAHRILIASAVSDTPIRVFGILKGDDITSTINCLTVLGAKFEKISDIEILVTPITKLPDKKVLLNAGESGSTLRFLLPLVASLGVNTTFIGEGRLAKRPIDELLNVLIEHGITASNSKLPLNIKDTLSGGTYKINGSISSQYITGLLLALPLVKEDSIVEVEESIVSANYIDITLYVLELYGIKIRKEGNKFYISGNQKYQAVKTINVESDWSSACFFAAGGVLSGDITLLGLNNKSLQGDSIVIDLLSKMNANITYTDSGITFTKSKLTAIEFSAKDCPDIVPIMSIVCANAKGITKIKDIERLRIKESNRLEAIIEMLTLFGIKTEYSTNLLTIYGGKITGADISGYNDHRMVMSEAISVCSKKSSVTIEGAEAINKSYPSFFEEFKFLGGEVEIV
jgi:3-phosphoshikimate 1-carboxyvinyltransferase